MHSMALLAQARIVSTALIKYAYQHILPIRWLTEDSNLLQSLGRDSRPIVATVDAVYKSVLDLKAEIQSRLEDKPVIY